MTILYNCKHAGDQYRITKFNDNMEVESSYLCTLSECECPAGVRDTCRHRNMLHKFLARNMVNTNWMLDYDRDGWVMMDLGEALEESVDEPELSGLQEETILMGFHQPELCTPVDLNTAGGSAGATTLGDVRTKISGFRRGL